VFCFEIQNTATGGYFTDLKAEHNISLFYPLELSSDLTKKK